MKKIFLALSLFCASASIMPAAAYQENQLTFGVSYDDSNVREYETTHELQSNVLQRI